ncbi:MAG TPA: protease inhibitor I42 family protein [Terriglobales bacterium]|nr:protease inhibitor I42 family protein [Terriglobales bacterium]
MTRLTLTERHDGQHLGARLHDLLELHLAENATTGYRWEIDSCDTGLLQLVETTAHYPSVTPGSGGMTVFRFRVIGTGSAVLKLKYWRHWEGAASVRQRFSVVIDAT